MNHRKVSEREIRMYDQRIERLRGVEHLPSPVTKADTGSDGTASLPKLTLDLFRKAAKAFAADLCHAAIPSLYGATDGKAVGTKVEVLFKEFLEQKYNFPIGNAANGLDFPSLNLDLKVTSIRQPQSSCPFRSAIQKIYGLGYNLLIIVYEKHDIASDKASYLEIHNVIYIDKSRTGDYTLTRSIREIVAEANDRYGSLESAIEDLDALLQDKNVPIDDVGRRQLAERLIHDLPEQGVLTISNALQWRLQYGRAISTAVAQTISPEVEDLYA